MKAKLLLFRFQAAVVLACGWFTVAQSAPVAAAETLVTPSPDRIHEAVASDQGRILYRKLSDKGVAQTFYICRAQALAFSDDGKLLVAASARHGGPAKIKVWRLGDRKQLCEIIVAGDGVKTLALSTDGSIVLGASADGRVEAWRVADGKMQWSHTFSSAILAMRIAADGGTLLVRLQGGAEKKLALTNGRNAPQHESTEINPKEPVAAKPRPQ